MHTASSARYVWSDCRSAVEYTATVLIPMARQARITRTAISPRFAMRTFSNMVAPYALAWVAMRKSTWSYSTCEPFAASTSVTMPGAGAVISFIIFMASTMASV